jgi:type II secretory pathway predicted ATPase ExeA
MYNEYYGFSRDPFLIVPDPNYLYKSSKHEEALARLIYGIKGRRAIMLLTGEVGTGKTTLIRYLVRHLPGSIQSGVITNSNLRAESLLRLILTEFGLPVQPSADKSALIKSLQNHLEGLAAQNRRALLIVDEAQNLPLDALEEIRMLSNFQLNNRCLVQILLVGQPELHARMKDPRFLQIAQRVALNYHLEALNLEETLTYIAYRLQRSGGTKEIFTADALKMVFQLSRGIPRSVNLVCNSALIYGFSEGLPVIDNAMVTKAAIQLDLMGLVDAHPLGEAAVPAQAAEGAGDGKVILEGIGHLEKSLAGFMNELRQETRMLGEHAGSVSSSARKLSEFLEKHFVQGRANYEKLQAESTKLKLLLKLLKRSPKQ